MQIPYTCTSGDNHQNQHYRANLYQAILDTRYIKTLSSLPDTSVGNYFPLLSAQTSLSREDNLTIPTNESGHNTLAAISFCVSHPVNEQASRITQMGGATCYEDLFSILDGIQGCSEIVARLRYLHEITQDNDPEDPPMQLSSLREFAQFFEDDHVLPPNHEIGISPNGLLQAEWHLSKASALMKFLPDGNIKFAATRGRKSGVRPIHGEDTKENALRRILSYIEE